MPSFPKQELPDYFNDLLSRYLEEQCTTQEVERLLEWLALEESNRQLLTALQKEFGIAMASPREVPLPVRLRIIDRLINNIGPERRQSNRLRLFRIGRWAAASLLVLVAAIFMLLKRGHKPIKVEAVVSGYAKDVAPGGDKAVLTLSDGSTIVLDSAADGKLANQGGTGVMKIKTGQLAYRAQGREQAVLINKISTPRGGQYQVLLADGTRVWLNAGSSLAFPIAFTGKERQVTLTGEGYFEVAENPGQPFLVKAGRMAVTVLGTHFDIMAYDDEQNPTTTLVEGAVKVGAGAVSSVLRPGQSASLDMANEKIQVAAADVEAVTAWKNGLFQFDNADLPAVMRQLSRWYDVDVTYEGKQGSYEFVGRIARSSNLSSVLKILQVNGVQFRIEGKRIIVVQ